MPKRIIPIHETPLSLSFSSEQIQLMNNLKSVCGREKESERRRRRKKVINEKNNHRNRKEGTRLNT